MTWNEFLQFLSQPNGINVFVGLAESVLVEYIPGFDGLQSKWKVLVFLGISMAVPLGAAGLGIATLGWSPGWEETFWPAVASGGTCFLSGTAAHWKMKQAE